MLPPIILEAPSSLGHILKFAPLINCVFCHSCFSSVGDQQTGQILSLGSGCDHKAVIEHELLHALGFYHEQSRTDRDDYVDIWLDQVSPGMFWSMVHQFVLFVISFLKEPLCHIF